MEWKFIRLLHEEQIKQGLKFGNKLRSRHINYHRHKMNVSIAAQTISSSVADAIEFLRDTLHPSFANSLASIWFIRIFDCIFYLLNSRNPLGTGFKRPLRLVDKLMWSKTIDESVEYLSNLKEGLITLATSVKRCLEFIGCFFRSIFIPPY